MTADIERLSLNQDVIFDLRLLQHKHNVVNNASIYNIADLVVNNKATISIDQEYLLRI